MPNTGYFDRATLLSVQSQDDVVSDLKTFLTGSGFANVNDWSPGTYQMNFLQLASYLFMQGQARAATLYLQGVESTASGSFLDAISNDFFGNTRFPGDPAQGNLVFVSTTGAGGNTYAQGQFTVTALGQQFVNANTIALVPGTTVTASFVAPQPGLAWNLANNSAFFPLNPLQGVTVTNPPNAGSTTWLTTFGADPMSDQALHVLNETKLSLLANAASSPADRVINAVVSASNGAIFDVQVDGSNPFGPGTVAVYCSFPMAPAPPSAVTAIQGTVSSIASFNPALVTVTSSVGVQFAGDGNNFPIQVWYAPGLPLAQLNASLVTALNGWLSSTPTGGNDYAGSLQVAGASGIADVDGLVGALYQVPGVRKVKVTCQQDIELQPIQKLTAPATDAGFHGVWVAPYLQLTASVF